MTVPLQLTVTDYRDEARWRWALTDDRSNFLADHEVALDMGAPEYRGFRDLPDYLNYYTPAKSEDQLLRELGEWMGRQVFGGLTDTFKARLRSPATVVMMMVPPQAQDLLFRPFELTHLDGQPFFEHGIRFVYQAAVPAPGPSHAKAMEGSLRILAVFSLPDTANPLNLRRERHQLKRLMRDMAQMQGAAIELRSLQYGATRKTLKEALEDGLGWDVVHFSGHGLEGELVLEDERGEADCIKAEELLPLLRLTRDRLKLLTLSACLSGAGSLANARAQLDLSVMAAPTGAARQTLLPSLAQQLAQELDCAVLAMRYPVGEEFALNLILPIYERMLGKDNRLPGALQLSLQDALGPELKQMTPVLSPATPILFGPRAANLELTPPEQPPDYQPRLSPLAGYFPTEPERFVGRLLPMLRASQALAPRSAQRGVLFYGMAGAGKTSCALELAYRYEQEKRFRGFVWSKCPDEGQDITLALEQFLQDLETQLGLQNDALTAHLEEPDKFQQITLPRLKARLAASAYLIVLDNLESLLTSTGGWRDPKWGMLVETLLSHAGTSRLVLTSRRQPEALKRRPALLLESIHALSFGESILLARELDNLRPLFATEAGRQLLRQTLRVVQGHPKLLELADRIAADPAALEVRLAQAERETAVGHETLATFFEKGETRQGEENFIATLHRWTTDLAATLPATARLLFHFLCRLEESDRQSGIIEANWQDFLKRLANTPISKDSDIAAAALFEPGLGLDSALDLLITTGLVESRTVSVSDNPLRNPQSAIENLKSFRLHPSVAESGLAQADPAALGAADIELGDFWIAMYRRGRETEMQGGGRLVVQAGRRAAPYLLRAGRWEAAATLLERVITRDTTPATLAMALPLLRQVAQSTEGTTEGLENAGVLAKALLKAGRYAEAERMQRDLMDQCVAQGNYRLASNRAGDLLNLLRETGQLQEALALAGQMAEFIRRAQLGPWTQLSDEGMRLQVLNTMGRYQEVLEAVQNLRGQIVTLPEQSQAEEAANPWNVRETLLNTGCRAAMGLEQWEAMLDLNAECVRFMRQRGADEMELARTRFNNYFPLLRLRRFREARELLEVCRAVLEPAHEPGIGKVLSALADLEDEEGHSAAAVRFEQVALRYRYQSGQPEDYAISHNNLANYLERAPKDLSGLAQADLTGLNVLAHRLADAVICFQIGSGGLSTSIRNLAKSDLPAAPPTFEQVAATVEQIEGVRFREMFERLPRHAPDGDAAIAAVWEMGKQERERRETGREKRERVLASLPPAVRAAFELDGEEFSRAFKAALDQLSPDEAQTVIQQLEAAGLIGTRQSAGPDMAEVLREFDPLLRGIAAVAQGKGEPRAQIEAVLPELEEKGWQLTTAVQRIWADERDEAALTAGIDRNSAQLVRRILELLQRNG